MGVIAKFYKHTDFIFLMGWKDWSYWLRGGIIGFLIYIPVVISTIGAHELGKFHSFIFDLGISNDYGWKFALIVYLVIGGIIGWVIGKIKSK